MTKKSRRVTKARRMLLTLSLVLVVAFAAVGGTIAWLTAETNAVVNTFTVGNIDITLTETGTTNKTENDITYAAKEYKMIPGEDLSKDPKVTVEEGSEECYVYVKVEKIGPVDTYLDYSIDTNNWKELTGVEGVYYAKVDADEGTTVLDEDVELSILTGNKVTVKSGVTKAQMDALEEEGATLPQLKFTAYAIQQSKITSETVGWTTITTPAT